MVMQQTSGSCAVVVTLGEAKEDKRVRYFPVDTRKPLMILQDLAGRSEADQGDQLPVLIEAGPTSYGSVCPDL